MTPVENALPPVAPIPAARPARASGAAWVVGFLAIVLLVALGAQWMQPATPAGYVPPAPLAEALPADLVGWRSELRPVGETEGVAAAVAAELRYDDVFYRRYHRGGDYLEVFVAYWTPGKAPIRKVATHNPDRCWTAVGWECTAMRPGEDFSVVGGPSLEPAQGRTFRYSGGQQYVAFWHLVGGEAQDYGERFHATPSVGDTLNGFWQQLARGKRSQYFIRLNATRPLTDWQGDPGFRDLLKALGQLGLAMDEPMAK